jgi:subtilisin family serine protease
MSLKINATDVVTTLTHSETNETKELNLSNLATNTVDTRPELDQNTPYLHYVTVDAPEFKSAVHIELTSLGGSETIPARAVECVKPYPGSLYNASFMLTLAEAEQLRQDTRVRGVQIEHSLAGTSLKLHGTRVGQYTRKQRANPNDQNWGLVRSISKTPNFTATSTQTEYTYNLDGSGVDIILIDSGVEPGHPEFAVNADGTGGTRVVDHDWTQYGIINTVPVGGFLGDGEGHGSNCASIAAGNTRGWASKAAIYSLRVFGGTSILDNTTSLGAVDMYEAIQTVTAFHNAKAIDPTTGYKRPTVLSMSIGFTTTIDAGSGGSYHSNQASVAYRGVTHITTTVNADYGTIGVKQFVFGGSTPARDAATDADISACLAAGVIVVSSAGNEGHNCDVPGGIDYNNRWTDIYGGTNYYHRGTSPSAADGVICVGATGDVLEFIGVTWAGDSRDVYSNTGARVDVWAPGSCIAGAMSNAGYFFDSSPDPRDPNYYNCMLSGTSMACPQVSGVAALLLQARPWMTPAQVREFIKSNAVKGILNENAWAGWAIGGNPIGTGYYTNFASLLGSPGGMLYMPFNNPVTLSIS